MPTSSPQAARTTRATHAWHCHTVTGDRWLILKAEYSHRCGDQLARAGVAHDERLVAQALDADLLVVQTHTVRGPEWAEQG